MLEIEDRLNAISKVIASLELLLVCAICFSKANCKLFKLPYAALIGKSISCLMFAVDASVGEDLHFQVYSTLS